MKTVTVRLPDDLHDRLKDDADRCRRSLNNQILWLIEEGLPERDAGPLAPLNRLLTAGAAARAARTATPADTEETQP